MPTLAHAIAFNRHSSYQHRALQLYSNFRTRSLLRQVWSLLTRQPKNLLNLADVEVGATGYSSCFTGLKRVPLHQIVGSQGRGRDFDQGFVPRRAHTKDRWIRIATARLRGIPLPPVRLVQVGDSYFVQDGHHRISVARALGQHEIEAEVAVWNVSRPTLTQPRPQP